MDNKSKQQEGLVSQKVAYEKLIKMHRRYKDDTRKVLTGHKKKKETRSIWFEKNDALTRFVTDLLNTSYVSGLRVYICEYDKDTLPPDLPEDKKHHYLNKLTVGFVATKLNAATGRHEDDPGEEEEKLLILVDPFNHGKLCPPDICTEDESD